MADGQVEEQQGGAEQQVAELFQNVGQGLLLIGKYVQGVAPDAMPAVEGILQQYDQLVQAVGQARQEPQGQAPSGPGAPEAGAAQVQQAI